MPNTLEIVIVIFVITIIPWKKIIRLVLKKKKSFQQK